MIKKRLFLLDSNCGDAIANIFIVAGHREAGVEIVKSKEQHRYTLPRGYDAYFLHPNNLREEDLTDLRNEQPYSWIYLTARSGINELPKGLREFADKFVVLLYPGLAKNILKQIQDYRTPEEEKHD